MPMKARYLIVRKLNNSLIVKLLYSNTSRTIKAFVAERIIRTIRGILYQYVTHQNAKRYGLILPVIIES